MDSGSHWRNPCSCTLALNASVSSRWLLGGLRAIIDSCENSLCTFEILIKRLCFFDREGVSVCLDKYFFTFRCNNDVKGKPDPTFLNLQYEARPLDDAARP